MTPFHKAIMKALNFELELVALNDDLVASVYRSSSELILDKIFENLPTENLPSNMKPDLTQCFNTLHLEFKMLETNKK